MGFPVPLTYSHLEYDPSSAHSLHPLLIAKIQTRTSAFQTPFHWPTRDGGSERHVPRSSDPLPLSMPPPYSLGATDHMFNTPGFDAAPASLTVSNHLTRLAFGPAGIRPVLRTGPFLTSELEAYGSRWWDNSVSACQLPPYFEISSSRY